MTRWIPPTTFAFPLRDALPSRHSATLEAMHAPPIDDSGKRVVNDPRADAAGHGVALRRETE